ncbi:heparan N-sulfatase [Lentisphaera araneosa HTCC2155]|uniref:Heparan N-sulfatase n=1 Tax=Lentisphaera araneosa HTCC2155 TaxID=313628 RepID=A6DLT6_9BACT|nr:sulfatase [Lentisphaera araneosa]EDM27541.1 heparan N-sulfatase [Lentisphaera araneosa HTCC2155]
MRLLVFFLSISLWASAEKPNILFCMADDWGWPHAGAYGDEGVKTPNFDRLAKEGMLFHHTYVSSPSCTPSRNAVITGKYHWQLGPGANLWSTLPVEHESFVHLLADSSYVIGQNRPKTWGPGKIESWEKHHGGHPAGSTYKDLSEFFDKTEAPDKNFFFWLATSDPHRGYKKDSGVKSGIDPAKVHLFDHYPDALTVRKDVADYYFEVQHWDALVGSALKLLEEKDLLENTIVIMTGDHGMPFPRCKGNLYDSGARVPFVFRWAKGVKAGLENRDFVSFADVAPTLLELCGVPVPKAMTGKSFVNLLLSEQSGAIDKVERPFAIFGRERHTPAQEKPNMGGYPSRAIRTKDFLYIRNYRPELWPMGVGNGNTNKPGQWYSDCDAGPTKDYIIDNKEKDPQAKRAYELCFAKRPAQELYHLVKDPDQTNNLAKDPEYAAVLEQLDKKMQKALIEKFDPRAKDPLYGGFDVHPYFGGYGGKRKAKK